MVNFLKDVSIDTFIGELPSILNFNNNAIEQEFSLFYDSSDGRLIKSVYAPNGTVQAHWGRFTNLEADLVKFTNADSLSQSLETAGIPHNVLSKKFRNDWVSNADGTNYDSFDNDFCHDPAAISSGIENNSNVVSLEDRLKNIESSIGISYAEGASSLTSLAYSKPLSAEEEYKNMVQSEPDYYFYTEEYLNKDVYNSASLMNDNDKIDLQIGKLFNYYSVSNKRYVKIDNSRPAYFYDTPKDSTIDIYFTLGKDSDGNTLNNPFILVLTREKSYTILKLDWSNADDPSDVSGFTNSNLLKLQLIQLNDSSWTVGPGGYSLPDKNWSIVNNLTIYDI